MLSTVTSHRRFLHQIPELDDQLSQTLMLVTGVLRGHRCDYFSPMPGCVYAWFDFGKEETTAFRAALDAVPVEEATGLPYSSRHPGRAHASGHDGDTAMALALCQWLSERPAGLERNVLVIFQPSEESGGGAKRVCEAGILSEYRVSRIFSLHLWPGVPAGTVASRPGALLARSNDVTVSVTGVSVHFSRGEEGVDAMLAGAEFLRRVPDALEGVPQPRILRFGKMTSGSDRSTVSGLTVLEGSMLTYREEDHAACRAGLERLAVEIGAQTGCALRVHLSEGYPAVWNDEALYEAVRTGLGADAPLTLEKPALEAEDFSFYQKYVPGVFFFLGVGNTPELHAPNFDFDDEAVLPAGVEFLRRLARLP